MSLKNRRGEYSWPVTKIDAVRVTSDRKAYAASEVVKANVSFKVVGGLRESFHPDVWTVAWEDFDKLLRLAFRVTLKTKGSIASKRLAETKKEVRRASFY